MDAPVAIITGAGSGIGRATALLLAKENYQLCLVGRTRETLETTADHIAARVAVPQPLIIITADIADSLQVDSAVEQAVSKFGRVDALINNAATMHVSPVQQTTDEDYRRVFAANVLGPARLVARLWPVFASQGGGLIVNVSSMATLDPFPGLGAYAASKSALESLTRSIANEGRDVGIRAVAIAPGAVETAMLREVVSAEQLPTARTLDAAAVARVIVEHVLGKHDSGSGKTIYVKSP